MIHGFWSVFHQVFSLYKIRQTTFIRPRISERKVFPKNPSFVKMDDESDFNRDCNNHSIIRSFFNILQSEIWPCQELHPSPSKCHGNIYSREQMTGLRARLGRAVPGSSPQTCLLCFIVTLRMETLPYRPNRSALAFPASVTRNCPRSCCEPFHLRVSQGTCPQSLPDCLIPIRIFLWLTQSR